MNTQEEILSYLRRKVPRNHFEEIKNIIPTAFRKAFAAGNDIVHIPKDRKRAQDRYTYIQDGLAGLQQAWSSQVVSTNPKGEFYTLMTTADVRLTAAVKPWKKTLRPAKYRLNNSKLNSFLMSPQLELGEKNPISISSDHTLNAIVIPLSPPRHMSQDAPLDIILAVPYFNSCADYHVWCTLNEFLAGYESEVDNNFDLAWPVIRKQMRRDEGLEDSFSEEL
ncbi:hypothetical protein [Pseudomonas marginalis]|uniref:Uncharacterized protein n=2 Tax=Pseudomonas marginalis TaxID=298 RepID=A0A3M4A533_PSEMA|nr:hypothetical protein [Pseudomonas marginalis]MCM2377912.1 hypothetical protein [Pseudomonas marginalis]OAJ47843.1 hypothetical protein AO064_26160 [Pseudomonas marginalis]RMO63222.1 hypothetical protein ALQ38_02231 [Pseudomonas marginalis pv. marginalis]RMP02051.1 hypothetical protein ALQ29_02584 [Pseudomonas marginalis pv. marginalis]